MAHPTAGLLWAACRPAPDLDAVRACVDAGANLDEAAHLATAQRVSPLLWRALEAAQMITSEEWAAYLKRDAARCHAQSRLVLPRIGELALAPLAAADIEPLVIKGAALADRYPDPGLRPMDDVDIVLPPALADAAAEVLVAAGWVALETPQPQTHEIPFGHPALPGLHLDLHRSMGTWRNRSNRLSTTQLWEARQPTTLFGGPAYVLGGPLELVMLAAHAGKPWHAYDRLVWVVDLAIVMAEGVDWDEVARLARHARCEAALAVGLTQAQHLDADSPAELRHLRTGWQRHALKPLLSPDWPAMSHTREQRATVRYALVDEAKTRVELAVSELTGDTPLATPRRTYWLFRRAARQHLERRRERLS